MLLLGALFGLLLAACGDDDEVKSTCVPDGPCEKWMLKQCECCSADKLDACKEDKTSACATGRLGVTLTADECQASLDNADAAEASGQGFCGKIAAETLEKYCNDKIMDQQGSGG